MSVAEKIKVEKKEIIQPKKSLGNKYLQPANKNPFSRIIVGVPRALNSLAKL